MNFIVNTLAFIGALTVIGIIWLLVEDWLGRRRMKKYLHERDSGDPTRPCDLPPRGWNCTRGKGHAGPCCADTRPVCHGAFMVEYKGYWGCVGDPDCERMEPIDE